MKFSSRGLIEQFNSFEDGARHCYCGMMCWVAMKNVLKTNKSVAKKYSVE